MVVKKANPYNQKYLQTKRQRMNHQNFGSLLTQDGKSVFDEPTIPPVRPSLNLNVSPGNNTFDARAPASLAEKYINEGEEMAAHAVATCLIDDDESQAGVTASEDGYCFGRQSVEDAIAAVKRGELVVVVDDMDRENEGDFIMAADLCTPEQMATIVRYSSGVICVGMEGKRMDELELPAMVTNNEDPKGTAFSVTVDAAKEHGITTGISAVDRAKTMQLLASSETSAKDFVRPGHIFPLRAKSKGVLQRDGHTEAAVDLCKLAGRAPVGVLCEIVSEENPVEMARLPELKRFCKEHGYVLTSIVDIAQYRRDTDQ
jgi:3,4-dihydroxy 2-butanone 4-phosphate synthase/GTP cyclohydrolase II